MINNFEELKQEVVSRLDIIDMLSSMTTIDHKGNGICPFHHDRRKGNFKANRDYNTYRCFACDARGNALSLLVEQKGNGDFLTAIYQAGYEFGLICEDEMKHKRIMPNVRAKKLGTPTQQKVVVTTKKEFKPAIVETKKELTQDEINLYDMVYRVFASYCGLDEKDKQHLLNDRKINSYKLSDYFSIRNLKEKKAIENTVNKLNSLNITKEQIANTPGFAYRKDGEICLAYIRGIGMKVRNSEGKVVGIQVRTDNDEKKYLWLSSSSKGGKGSSTPVSIEYSKMVIKGSKLNLMDTLRNEGNSILITEGKFKAQALAEEFKNISFGIAGINNWRNKVKNEFLNITTKKPIDNVVIFADADCAYNPTIFIQFKEMLNNELKNMKQDVYVAYWNINYGKGIDDVIHTNNKDKVKYLKLEEYAELFYNYLEEVNKYDIDDVNSNREDKINAYNKIFNL